MDTKNFALTSLYHPGTAAKISIPLDMETEVTLEAAKRLILSVDNLISAGFTVDVPGLEQGEQYQQIGYVVRREKINADQTITPIVDLYPVEASLKHRFIGLYLNTDKDVADFKTATGVDIEELPVYDGNPIERGKNPKHDRYIHALKSPAKIVWMLNPAYEGPEDKKHSKRKFVRWDGLRPAVTADLETGEVYSEHPAQPATGDKQYEKMSADLIKVVSDATGLKANMVAPIMAKYPAKTVSIKTAVQFVTTNYKQTQE